MVTQRPSLKSRREAKTMDVGGGIEREHRSTSRRLRSGALLGALLLGIGVAAAVVIGVLAVALAALADQALG